MRGVIAGVLVLLAADGIQAPEYRVQAVRYARVPDFPTSVLVAEAGPDERTDIAMVVWLIRGSGRTILFDAGFHREAWFDRFEIEDYIRPDSAVALAGVAAGEVTDVIVSHAHWDHMGGIDLFPNATIWIQAEEYGYYTGDAWQPDGRNGGIDPEDVLHLVERNLGGQVRLIEGDDVEILPGVRAYTGGRHTFASQYVRVDRPRLVLASDNAYLRRNLERLSPVATFTDADSAANVRALRRMIELAGGVDRVVPGHDPAPFEALGPDDRVLELP